MKYFYYVFYQYMAGKKSACTHVEYSSLTPLNSLAEIERMRVDIAGMERHKDHSGFEIVQFQLLRTVCDLDLQAAVHELVKAANAQIEILSCRIKEAAQILRGQAEMSGKTQKLSLLAVVNILEP